MATKAVNLAALGGSHTSGIFSDMSADGPVIGTLVVIMDRARNLPNKRAMGKQDPYVAARLGKEAKKTKTDKRGGQTPRWDQELRFTVHDSIDYHRLKVSVFNDDKKTELIGETWVSLEAVIAPGGGTSDNWHGLNCKGKYAGEIRLEFTYYDSRSKPEKPAAEKRRESARADGQTAAAVRGPRESKPVKRRPLPTDPTGASPSPLHTPEHRAQRGAIGGPRELRSARHQQTPEQPSQQRSQPRPADPAPRRPVSEATPLGGTPVSNHNTPQPRRPSKDPYSTPPNPRSSNPNIPLTREESFDMSYTAPKSYETQTLNPAAQQIRDSTAHRAASQDDFRASQGHLQQPPTQPIHSQSAPMVPTQHGYEHQLPPESADYHNDGYADARSPSYAHDQYQDPAYQVAPLRTSRSREYSQDPAPISNPYLGQRYIEAPPQHDLGSSRRRSAMQPMVEDEDDLPPPPPVHRRDATTLPHPNQEELHPYHNEAPTSADYGRYHEEPSEIAYEPQVQHYVPDEYSQQPPSERRLTYPHAAEHESNQLVQHDAMIPSPLRQDTVALPASLIAGHSRSRDSISYQAPPAYETPPQLRHYSEPAEYRAITQHETPADSQALVHHSSFQRAEQMYDYPHDPPEQPRRTSPIYNPAPLVKPRATSPGFTPSPRHSPNPASDRNARGPSRTMPTRKSVSPRPPPSGEDLGEPRLSGVAFDPDSFDVFNPRASRSPIPGASDDERPGSSMEYNEKGQIVTFSGRVVDASDHLPIDNWAPEPTPKGTVKEKPFRARAQLHESRDLEAARDREERYRQERLQRDRIRQAASETFDAPSNALVTTRHDFSSQDTPDYSGALVLAGPAARNRYQARPQQQRPTSTYDAPDSHVLRERHNPNSYGSSPSYDRGGGAGNYGGRGPPIPAKIPLETSAGGHGGYSGREEDLALSLELQSIDIGPGSGGRRPKAQARRQYGF